MKDDKNYHDGNSKDNKMNQTLALTKLLSPNSPQHNKKRSNVIKRLEKVQYLPFIELR